jgi:hypothetical protein
MVARNYDMVASGATSVTPVTCSAETDGDALLGEVHDYLTEYIAYPSEHCAVAHTLWLVHTHLMDVWESTPRLAFLSPEPGSGKTRALEITELLVPRPLMAINASPAYVFPQDCRQGGRPHASLG